MPRSHGNHSHSDAAKMEQIITEFYTKSLHIILESRTPYVSSRNFSGEQIMSMSMSSPSSSSSSASASASASAASSVRPRPRDKWFNLALRGYPGPMENLDLWHHSNPEPMVVDVVLVQRPLDWDPTLNFSPTREEIVIERWVLQYDHTRKVKDNHSSGSSRRSSNTTLHTLYKKSMLLLRSLYLTVRLLPAYKVFRDLNSSAQLRTFSLAYHVYSVIEPFPRSAEAEMQRFGFTPIETSAGRLCLSVLYRSSVLDLSSEPTPLTPQVIPDYVGSPLAEPLKRFPSLPVAGLGNHGSPSSLPFSRRHSWSFDLYRACSPSVSFSPSPTHSESNASISNPAYRRFPPTSLPPHPPGTSIAHKNTTSFDEYCPSPTFSPSPSPSPPIYIPGTHLSKGLLRSESAPVNIPTTRLSSLPALSNKQYLPPSPPIKSTRSGTLRTDKFTCPIQTGAAVEQLFSLGKDDNRKYFGTKISSNDSPQISFSRSSSRSLPDDFDDPEFDCPFDVDDDDMTDPGSRPGSFDQKGHISQDAAVGDLVRMLKKAPPLCPEFSNSVNVPQASGSEIWSSSIQEPYPAAQNAVSASSTSSGLVRLKTTADALEELQGYREMKKLLLKQGSKSYT
ncbi:hypothetical protein SO802_026238 [Lithocarpus litseifolius]|uniref:Autophagy-related protein 13 N-terminal domain-containing protein n=1 Tax=Lithocarpus litseifolius TaxID=425828 RepID=A0AAW2BZZ1_9ROSI